jgi:DDE superfamily endonuclease
MRQQKWEKEYANNRLIMWDNTNVPLCFMPTDAEAQRNTYSTYYTGNVGKGAVFIQPCGWMGTHELWMGAVSDTEYMLRSKVFEQQELFIKHRDPINSNISWLNMLDRGYRNLGDYAWNRGQQMIVQPNFARSDDRFTSYETLRSASVASIRAGNERAVKNIKACKYISTGLHSNESCVRMCDVWLCWGFQINYMYKPVH